MLIENSIPGPVRPEHRKGTPDPFTGMSNDEFAQGLLMIIGRKERGELLGPTILTQVISLL